MPLDHKTLSGRRALPRLAIKLNIALKFRNGVEYNSIIDAHTLTVNRHGLSCKSEQPIPDGVRTATITGEFEGVSFNELGYVKWVKESRNECGIYFKSSSENWIKVVDLSKDAIEAPDRRSLLGRSESKTVLEERRHGERRFSELLREVYDNEIEVEGPRVKTFLRSKSTTHSPEVIQERREWIAELTNTEFKHIQHFSEEPSDFINKIENPIGVAHTPLGIAGPLKINGRHAKGTFFVPLATTEGALVTSYTLGSHIITRSGGANVRILKDELRVGPMFVFKTLKEASAFVSWTKSNLSGIKAAAEKTSKHLVLIEITHIIDGRKVIVNFHYKTGDAMGMNMACRATDAACVMMCKSVKPEEFWLRSNFNANKKATAHNLINGYGKTVTADVTIPRRLIGILDTTPEQMQRYFFRTLMADTHAGMIGANGHFANGIAAMFIACGQDVASVANSHIGMSSCEVTANGDLYFCATLPSILVGTVGGGTSFGTARDCLQMLRCLGSGHSNKFAEIVAATALAGEIAICASIVNGTYVLAHETFGRNRPK